MFLRQGDTKQEVDQFMLKARDMIRACVFYQGRCLVNFEDIGYNDINEVVNALMLKLPEDTPEWAMLQLKIVNLDSGRVYACEHQKGKGFK